MAQELVTKLFDTWSGLPILVIGGGPSVIEDLPFLVKCGFKPGCVISANDHGAKQTAYKVNIFTNMDHNHCLLKRGTSNGGLVGIPMREIIEPLAKEQGAYMVNRFSWADYRLGDWMFKGNTGMAAIVLAAALGGSVVVPVGIDFFQGGHTYFHKLQPTKMRKAFALSRIAKKKVKDLMHATKGANIRPLSGPLLEFFPKFKPCVPVPPSQPIHYRTHMLRQKTHYVFVHREFSLNNSDRARIGETLALTPKEALNPKMAGFATR